MRDFKYMQAVQGPSRGMRARVLFLGVGFLVLFAVLFARAVQLQIHQQGKLKAFAEDQYVRAMKIPARRGDIFDRRGVPLAQSVEVASVWVDPPSLEDPQAAARALGEAVSRDWSVLAKKFQKGRRFAWVKRKVTPAEVARVKALALPGVGFVREPRRFYPQRELAAHVLGLVGMDAQGLDGIEKSFEDELSGERVTREGFCDAKGRKLLTNGVEDPHARQGANLILTIDRQLQYVTENALSKAVADAKATAGMAIMLDPQTGALLALANVPRYNPNAPRDARRGTLRNRAVTDIFEPGSTVKPFVIASALDEKIITENTSIDCERGAFIVGHHVVHDSHSYGALRPHEILQRSSNIGAAKVARKLGRKKLVKLYQRLGFDERFGIGLPGEGRGRVPFPHADIMLATQAFGQGISVTALQLTAAYGALANGGLLMRPYIVSRIVDAEGRVLVENKPTRLRRVMSAQVARRVLSMLEGVVAVGGTAPRAHLQNYRVAGKTGTAQKVDTLAGGYSHKHIASFVGIVPALSPRVVILVVIDEPQDNVYGGVVAAPAFKAIAEQAMPYLGVSPSRPLVAVPSSAPAPVASSPPKQSSVLPPWDLFQMEMPAGDGEVRVPNLQGFCGRTAISQLLGVMLEPYLQGSGHVVAQHPAAGALVDRGTRITLKLARNSYARTTIHKTAHLKHSRGDIRQ